MVESWDFSYLLNAIYWSHKSHDEQTKCGCCIAAKDHTIISFGYNGFIRNIDDTDLPKTRPEKYPYMIHAETNALLNALRQGKSTLGATAYITGKPCVNCLQFMWQAGIDRVVYTDYSKPKMIEDQDKVFDTIIQKTNLDIEFVPYKEIVQIIKVKVEEEENKDV